MDTLARMEKSDFLASISFQSKAGGSIMDCIDWIRPAARFSEPGSTVVCVDASSGGSGARVFLSATATGRRTTRAQRWASPSLRAPWSAAGRRLRLTWPRIQWLRTEWRQPSGSNRTTATGSRLPHRHRVRKLAVRLRPWLRSWVWRAARRARASCTDAWR